jgi:DNA-binding response OmpR family regulator
MSRVIIYSSVYSANLFIYYRSVGTIFIAGTVTSTDLAKLFAPKEPEHRQEKVGIIKIDTPNGSVEIQGVTILLTVTELRLLKKLVGANGNYLTRQELLDTIGQNRGTDERLIDSHLKRLRNKLRKYNLPNIIDSRYGFGYKIDSTKLL